MAAFRVTYQPGEYDQSALEPKKRLRDEDVADFIRFWMQGRWTTWMGEHFKSQRGTALHPKMVRSHARRLQDAGLIPAPDGYVQPHWTSWRRPPVADDGPPVIGETGVVFPGAHRYAVRLNKGGRPPRRRDDGPGPAAEAEQLPVAERQRVERQERFMARAHVEAGKEGQPTELSKDVLAYLRNDDTQEDKDHEEGFRSEAAAAPGAEAGEGTGTPPATRRRRRSRKAPDPGQDA